MRRGLTAILLVIVLSLASGCQVRVVQPPSKTPSTTALTPVVKPTPATPTTTVPQQITPTGQTPSPAPITDSKLTKVGIYFGLADNHTIEVSIDGKPVALRLTDEVMPRFQALKLKKDDKIEIVFFENSDKQLVVTEIRVVK